MFWIGAETRVLNSPVVHIPIDRRQALARGRDLPDFTSGAALLADVSGFTTLTRLWVQALGPQRGAEEISRRLNDLFDALITEVDRYGGAVISFGGDAITCWFDGDTGHRAATCALRMQAAMRPFAVVTLPDQSQSQLALKVTITVGPARRFLVGNPDIQVLEVIAGATVDRLAAGDSLTARGEVLIDAAAQAHLNGHSHVGMTRIDEATGSVFLVLASLAEDAPPQRWPLLPHGVLTEDKIRPWLLPPVYERLHVSEGEFLAELRPVASLFMRFLGIDYDADPQAGQKLDQLVRVCQETLARYEGYLLHMSLGDKGSYLSAAFGAPIAHDDDASRAASAALDLHARFRAFDFLKSVQIGLSRGSVWTGPYGGSTRQTYGVIGDAINMAARLMMAAAPGEILVSQRFATAAGAFLFEPHTSVRIKGRSEPIPVATLVGPRAAQSARHAASQYALPMVGREAELALLAEKLAATVGQRGQIVAVTGEAGIGKSRLIAEVVSRAEGRGFAVYEGEAQSHAVGAPYWAWQSVWRAFFGLNDEAPPEEQTRHLETELRQLDEAFGPRLPLLDTVLGLPISDNELTRSFDAKLRKVSLEALLVDCLKARTRTVETPMLIVLEDCHWLDPLSDDLLEQVGRAVASLPVMLLLAYRPPEAGRGSPPRITSLPHCAVVQMVDFTPQEAERLIDLKLAQLAVADGDARASEGLKTLLVRQAQGNPFYIDEFINYLRDQGLDLRDAQALQRLDLPDNLQSLILSRIDQLVEREKTILKVASVIGRLFQASWLADAYPDLVEPTRVHDDLDRLQSMDLIVQDRLEPELTYLFKHILTQEVAYESLTYATRARLHSALAHFIERFYPDALEQYLDLLAYHYSHSTNEDKQREYLRRAGEAAQARYANTTAIDYYRRLLPLLADVDRIEIMLKLGQVLELVGQWQEAENSYRAALALADGLSDDLSQARCQSAIGTLLRKRGAYDDAMLWLTEARAGFEALGDAVGMAQTLHESGTLAAQQGNYALAETLYGSSLAIRRASGDRLGQANTLNNLGIIARSRGAYAEARALYEESLALNRALDNQWAIANSLNNLANVVLDQGDLDTARALHEEGLAIRRQLGDRWAIANSLNNLGNVVRDQGDSAAARNLYAESIDIYREFGDRRALAYLLEDLACLATSDHEPELALRLTGAAAALREAIQAPLTPNEQRRLEQVLAQTRQAIGQTMVARLDQEGRAMSLDQAIEYAIYQHVA